MNDKIKCIIIEDEPLATEVIIDYVRDVPFLELVETFTDAIYALEFLKNHQVDLIFLDIHLPKIKGFEFVRTLQQPPKIIVTTAYHQYALEGFDLDVVDYLLKPIEFSRFLKAVNKVSRTSKEEQVHSSNAESKPRTFQFVQSNKTKTKIFHDEILYIESIKEYLHIHTLAEEVIIQGRMEDLPRLLDNIDLTRIHRSFAVVTDKVRTYSASKVQVGNSELPIGRTYKEAVHSKFNAL